MLLRCSALWCAVCCGVMWTGCGADGSGAGFFCAAWWGRNRRGTDWVAAPRPLGAPCPRNPGLPPHPQHQQRTINATNTINLQQQQQQRQQTAAGQHFEIRDEGDWWAAVPDDEWPADAAQRGERESATPRRMMAQGMDASLCSRLGLESKNGRTSAAAAGLQSHAPVSQHHTPTPTTQHQHAAT